MAGLVTIFGGSGFVGQYVTRALVKDGWNVRIASRKANGQNSQQVEYISGNLTDKASVTESLKGADAVVNLVGILFEDGPQTFESMHIEGPKILAEIAAQNGIINFAHVSAIGADGKGASQYSKTKGKGEELVSSLIPSADILRPSIIFGPEDDFFNRFADMSQFAPALPLIGGGKTKFQPVYVGDVADAVAKVLAQGTNGQIYELGGPKIYSFKDIMQIILDATQRKRLLIPIPWVAAGGMGMFGDLTGALPMIKPFLTLDQVKSLKVDNIVTGDFEGFEKLGIVAKTAESIVPQYLGK